MSRTNSILSLRPDLNLALTNYHSDLEKFQNLSLRPILKLQHTITVQLLLQAKHIDSNMFKDKSRTDCELLLKDFMKSNVQFRNQVLGIIIGMMTEEEFDTYTKHDLEINKRIFSMQLKRYLDTFCS